MSEKKQNNCCKNTQQGKRINNIKNSEYTEQSDNQDVSVNKNEKFNSEYDSYDDNYIAMVEHINQIPIAMQNMTITNGNKDCNCLLASGSGCTIIYKFHLLNI